DAADGGEALGADESLALGPELALPGGEALGHRIELVGEDRELVAAPLRHGHDVRRTAAEALRGLRQADDRPERAVRKPGEEQADGKGEKGEPDHGEPRIALLPLRLLDPDVH